MLHLRMWIDQFANYPLKSVVQVGAFYSRLARWSIIDDVSETRRKPRGKSECSKSKCRQCRLTERIRVVSVYCEPRLSAATNIESNVQSARCDSTSPFSIFQLPFFLEHPWLVVIRAVPVPILRNELPRLVDLWSRFCCLLSWSWGLYIILSVGYRVYEKRA